MTICKNVRKFLEKCSQFYFVVPYQSTVFLYMCLRGSVPVDKKEFCSETYVQKKRK